MACHLTRGGARPSADAWGGCAARSLRQVSIRRLPWCLVIAIQIGGPLSGSLFPLSAALAQPAVDITPQESSDASQAGHRIPAEQNASNDASPIGEVFVIEPAKFKSIQPGVSTLAEVEQALGQPNSTHKEERGEVRIYRVDSFDRVTVQFSDEKVTSIIIDLSRAFPCDMLAEQLQLSSIRAVDVPDDAGGLLGRAYPERGVLFSFAPNSKANQVNQIIIDRVDAQPFALRAEVYRTVDISASLRDLEYALQYDPQLARAHWLRAEILAGLGRVTEAITEVDQALAAEPQNLSYRLTHARLMAATGDFVRAIAETQDVVAHSDQQPEVKPRALLQLGDQIASGPDRAFQQAIEHHQAAIKAAEALVKDPRGAVRLEAHEVLLDAHLAVANDIAWGNWKSKANVIPQWLDRAEAVATKLDQSGGAADYNFHAARGALGVCVGLQGKADPSPWVERVVTEGERLISQTPDPLKRHALEWQLGMALYDALQIDQMREQYDLALTHGQKAVEYLEPGLAERSGMAAQAYLMGRLYFRMGVIEAIHHHDHQAATGWYDKAAPLLNQPIPASALADTGRQGETFVSMAVSYWDVGHREQALELTSRGVELMEQAVQEGILDADALGVPYANLASMHRQLGHDKDADEYERMSAKRRPTRR